MEAAAGRGGSLPVPSPQIPRKEWRAVSEHSFRNNGNEDPEHVKLGQSDERTIYEVQEGTGPLDVDFCSITIDDGGGSNNDILQQRLHDISRKREELQQMEIELRAQVIARSEILELQSSFDAQIKEHANAAAKLKELVQEREQRIHELEMNIEEKDRELRAIRIDNEAAWAKEDLLREQNKELATFRSMRDNSEAERSQHVKQIHEFQEHIQEKESQFLELEEQHRIAQETIIFKEKQLRDVQAWVARVQEMDALQSTTNQSLQAELRDRTEQFNQYWIGFQQQFADMERHHLQTIQQLQRELAEARERNEMYTDSSQVACAKDSSSHVQNKGNHQSANDGDTSSGNKVFISNGNLDAVTSFVSGSNASTKTEHVPGVPVVPSSILGMGSYIPSGQMTALHPFLMHPQGVPQSVSSTNSPIPQSHVGHFQTTPAIPSHQSWQNQQAAADISQAPNQNQYQPSQTDHNLLRSDAHYSYEHPTERLSVHPDYQESHINPHQRSGPVIHGSSEEVQVLESNGKQYHASQEQQEALNSNSPFHATLGFDSADQKSELKVQDENKASAINQSQEQLLMSEQQWSASNVVLSVAQNHPVSSINSPECNEKMVSFPEVSVSAARTSSSVAPGKSQEPNLLDERSLLACIVRAIPAGSGGRIRISTTLPNRLGKMLAPLHWHDYKKQYGKLDDFVARHPELFVIEGDFIHLRDGAQEIISATTAVAKVAAAAAASAPYSSLLPSVAVTPIAHNRQKISPTADSKPVKTTPCKDASVVAKPGDSFDKHSQNNQQTNGVCFNVVQGLMDVKILTKSKNLEELNGLSSEMRPDHSSIHVTVGNGAKLERASLGPSQNKGLSNGKHGFGGKQQGRSAGAGLIARR